jgi:hypothetical protein
MTHLVLVGLDTCNQHPAYQQQASDISIQASDISIKDDRRLRVTQ